MANDPKQLQELYWEIEQHYAPDQGWCDAPACSACDKAELQVEAAKEAARKGFLLNKPAAQKPVDPASQRQIFERGYDKGRNVALQEAHQWAAQSAQRAEMAAKSTWYQKGLREGREMAQKSLAAAAPKAARGKLMDQVPSRMPGHWRIQSADESGHERPAPSPQEDPLMKLADMSHAFGSKKTHLAPRS